jgi:hypothetical protein
MKIYNVKIELLEDMLGTVPKNKDVWRIHKQEKAREIMKKHAAKGIPLASGDEATESAIALLAAEEIETIKEVEEKGWTGFHEDKDGPFLYDYAVKGFLKEAARTARQFGLVKQLQDKFTRLVFIDTRRVRLPATEGVLERPLRADGPKGPRVTVVRSDVVKAGTVIEFGVKILDGGSLTEKILVHVLEYGEFIGLGQWRSGGNGRFKIVEVKKTGEVKSAAKDEEADDDSDD